MPTLELFFAPDVKVSSVPSMKIAMFFGMTPLCHLREGDEVAGAVAEDGLGRAVEGLPAGVDDVSAFRQEAGHGVDVVDFEEQRRGAERARGLEDLRRVGADAVARLVHHFDSVALQDDEAQAIAVRHLGGAMETESVPQRQQRLDAVDDENGCEFLDFHAPQDRRAPLTAIGEMESACYPRTRGTRRERK